MFCPITRRRLLGAGLGAAGLALVPGVGFGQRSKKLKWGSASLGSTGYVIIEALVQAVNEHTDLNNSALATAGGAENMALIGRGQLDFGQSTSSDWPPATQGKKPYNQPVEANQMVSYTVWNIPLIVHADSDIERFEDLAGRRVMPSTAGGATATMYRAITQAAGLYDRIEWTYGSWNESFNAFKSGAVDAVPVVLTNGRAQPQIEEIRQATDIRVLTPGEEVMTKASQINQGVLTGQVTAEQWDVLDSELTIPSISGVLAAHPDISEEVGYTVTKAIYENAAEIRQVGVQLQDVSLDFATRYLIPAYPVNAGAARYFREAGVWRDELKVAS